MKAADVVKMAMKIRGYTNEYLAQKMGYAHASGVSQRLRGAQDMRMDVFVRFMDMLDCDIIVKSRTNDKYEWNLTKDRKPELEVD